MFGESLSSPPRQNNRPDYKNLSSSSYSSRKQKNNQISWKEKFRNNCVERINNARTKQFDSRRRLDEDPFSNCFNYNLHSENMKSQNFLQQIIKEEWENMQRSNYQMNMGQLELDSNFLADIEKEILQESLFFENNTQQTHTNEDELDELRAAEYEQYESMILDADLNLYR
ncbi:hypothetical protein BB558_006484 [Smittium angustum]|uniref:RPA-interacting protein N-terminal domain-containing protein n=1 Tax=Smittium angustum TaxID=133377 RepID=A0A2U1IXP7_SMIAN|nr:hypothetical protein BB558_006484 [Smittium angustum]